MRQRILLYKAPDNEHWIAHALDEDLTGAGPTPLAAFDRLAEAVAVAAEVRRALGDDAAPPARAPARLWAAFRRALRLPPAAANLAGVADVAPGREHELAILFDREACPA